MPEPVSPLRHTFRAFAHRNFRLYFLGQAVSLIGTWMQQVAMSWLVYRLTGSTLLLGVVAFAGQIPTFVLSPIAGVIADRWNRHRMIVITQTVSMLQAFALAVLAMANLIEVWHVIGLSIVLGVANAFDITGRQAFFTQMVARREDLANAIALNSSMVNVTRLIGPSLAGIVIAATGEGICFLLNGLSYLAVLIALVAMNVPRQEQRLPAGDLRRELWDGFTYTFGFPPIRAILLLLALVSFAGLPYSVLLPVFATEVLHGGPGTYGFLMAAAGVGALAAALYLTARRTILGLGVRIGTAPAVFGAALLVFAASGELWLSLILLFIMGAAVMIQMAASNTVLQTIVAEDKRGRVMSFYTMAFMGMTPLGSLLVGALADAVGAGPTLLAGGACCIAGSLWFLSRLKSYKLLVRPIYQLLGILPPPEQQDPVHAA